MKWYQIVLLAVAGFVLYSPSSVPAITSPTESLLSRIEKLEARKECNCSASGSSPAVAVKVAVPAAPVQMIQQCQNGVCRLVPVAQSQQPQVTYFEGSCSSGSCGTVRRGLFGRRR